MIYFDNASTTALSDPVYELVCDALKNSFANPSSLHSAGFEVEKLMTKARERVASAMGVNADDVYFTSGGTEANNTAVLGAARAAARNGKHLITTVIEHPSVADSFRLLEEEGYTVTYLPVDENGLVSVDDLKTAMDSETTLVSIMYVNNEVGAIQDIKALSETAKAINPHCVFHTDCVQAFGKHRLPASCVDMISVSGHKIHAPKGVGALYVKKGTRIKNLHLGGGQEKGLRPGTENTAAIIGFGLASETAAKAMDESFKQVSEVKKALFDGISELEDIYINGSLENSSPYILNVSFKGVKGEVLLHALERQQIYVATGSACSSKLKKKKKIVDLLIDGRGENNVRFSFSSDNTTEEAKTAADVIKKEVPILRRFVPR